MTIEDLYEPNNIRAVKGWMDGHGVKDSAVGFLLVCLLHEGSRSYSDLSYYSGESERKVKATVKELTQNGLCEVVYGLGHIGYVHPCDDALEAILGGSEGKREECKYIEGQVERRKEMKRQSNDNRSPKVKYLDRCLEAYEEVFGQVLERDGYCVGALLKSFDKACEVCKYEGVTIKEWARMKWTVVKMDKGNEGGSMVRVEDKDYNRFIRTRDHVSELKDEIEERENENIKREKSGSTKNGMSLGKTRPESIF